MCLALSLRVMFSRLIQVLVCVSTSLLSVAEQDTMVERCHLLSIHMLMNMGGGFHLEAIVNCAALNNPVQTV